MDLLTRRQLLSGARLAWAGASVLQTQPAGRYDAAKTAADPDGYL